MRRILIICLLMAALGAGWVTWRGLASRQQAGERAGLTIEKQPIVFASHTFDPTTPPVEMPPLGTGESAECDSDFRSSASVRGETQEKDGTHATVTVTQIRVTLQLSINIWVPSGATQTVMEHEGGHRQISEYFYQGADKLAERIAARYMGRQIDISGADLNAESSKALHQMANEITSEYNKELNPGPTQRLYDSITDHGRSGALVKDAVAHAIKNAAIESAPTTTN